MPTLNWPTPEEGWQLHQRLVQEDPTASSDLFLRYALPLVQHLQFNSPKLEERFWYDAAHDAITSLLKNPQQYKPERGDLGAYLRMAAAGDLKNLLAKETRQKKYQIYVEEDFPDGNEEQALEEPTWDDSRLQEVIAQFTLVEQAVFHLMQTGERKTEMFAEIMGILDQSVEEQRKQVKQIKDRLMTRLRRRVKDHA